MSDVVTYAIRDGMAMVVVDNPPVNAIGAGVPEGIEAALDRAAADPGVRAIVVMGAGRTFMAGADIALLEDMAWGTGEGARGIHDLLLKIEDLSLIHISE